MKTMKKIVIVLFVTFLSIQVNAQISLGGQASFIHLFGKTGINTFGIGVKGDYAKSEKIVITAGFNYFIPSTYSDYTYGNSFSSMTSPSQIDVDVDYKVSLYHVFVGGKYYLVNDCEDDFGLYGIAEAGLMMGAVTTTLGDFNDNLYYTSMDDGAKESLSNFTLDIGIGGEFDLDFGYLFADLKLLLPVNTVDGQTVEVEIPASVSLSVGVRIPL